MKILVRGGLGYIGSRTCVELVKAGYAPVALDNRRAQAEPEWTAGSSIAQVCADTWHWQPRLASAGAGAAEETR